MHHNQVLTELENHDHRAVLWQTCIASFVSFSPQFLGKVFVCCLWEVDCNKQIGQEKTSELGEAEMRNPQLRTLELWRRLLSRHMQFLAACTSNFFQGQILCEGQLNVAHNWFGKISSPPVHLHLTGNLLLRRRKKYFRQVVNFAY